MYRSDIYRIVKKQKYNFHVRKKVQIKKLRRICNHRSFFICTLHYLFSIKFPISDLPEEHIYAIALNTKNQITGIFEVGKGTVNCSLISAREILIRMLLAGAVSFILCHNHPSGDTNPSQEDIQITESIGKAGSLIGVSLLDHLIIGEKNYTSLREIQAVTFE